MCCFGDNPDEACGWPPKTVRATIATSIAIIVSLTLSVLSIFFAVVEEYNNSLALTGMLASELTGVTGYYFGSRTKESASTEAIRNEVSRQLEV